MLNKRLYDTYETKTDQRCRGGISWDKRGEDGTEEQSRFRIGDAYKKTRLHRSGMRMAGSSQVQFSLWKRRCVQGLVTEP